MEENDKTNQIYIKIDNPTIDAAKLYIEMVGMNDLQGFTLIGPAGMGKTYTIRQELDKLGIDYVVFGGHITTASTYEFLLENDDKLILFDDVSQVVNKVEIMELLKQALNTTGQKRIIHYRSKSGLTLDFPKQFEFKGRVIFTFNVMNKRNPNVKAIIDRAPIIELKFTRKEMFDIMYQIANSEGYGLSVEEKKMITQEMEEYSDSSMDISLRKQQLAFKIYFSLKRMGKVTNWKSQIHLLIGKRSESWMRELVRDLVGEGQIKRKELAKEIAILKNMSPRNAQRKISDFLSIGEIYQNKLKGGDVSIIPFVYNKK